MKFLFSALLFCLLTAESFAQKSEELIPRDAVTTFSINNINLLKKISMDDLVQYDFMAEVQSELFDGSTNDKTLKDAGFDFNQRINAFFGQTQEYEISGFTFGISDESSILQVFDDFDEIQSHIPGVKILRSELNYLFIKGSSVLILRVDPNTKLVKDIADSIWYESGYGYYIPDSDLNIFNADEYYEEDDTFEEVIPTDIIEETMEDSTLAPFDEFEDLDLLNKNYWELRDSIRFEYQQLFIRKISTELFMENRSLYSEYPDYQAQLNKPVDGVFYLDNSRNLTNNKGIWQFQNLFPSLFSDTKELYDGNIITGELNIVKNEIIVDIKAKYGEKLGRIYSDMTNSKFEKNFQKYIHKDALAYFTYNANLKNGYHTSFDVIMDMIRDDEDQKVLSNVLLAELINEFVDVDNIFEVYQGSMFGSLNGYKKIKTTRIDYQYDEETFEYSETEVEDEQDIPNFTIGFKTEKPEFLNRISKVLSKVQPDIVKHEGYYEIQNAILNTIPGYFAIVGNTVIFSVDENLFTTHLNGYAKSERVNIKKAKKSKFTFVHLDLDQALMKLPKEVLTERQNEIVSALTNKSGIIELKTVKNTRKETSFQLNYTLNEDIENNGKYLLDLINSLYTLTKK